MKDEVTKYKSRADDLEAELAARGNDTTSKAELEALRTELISLRERSDASGAANEELQRKLASLQGEHDRALSAYHTDKVAPIEAEVERLSQSLKKAQSDLEESHTLNGQLNVELQAALQNSPRSRSNKRNSTNWPEAGQRLQQELNAALDKSSFNCASIRFSLLTV